MKSSLRRLVVPLAVMCASATTAPTSSAAVQACVSNNCTALTSPMSAAHDQIRALQIEQAAALRAATEQWRAL